MQVTLEQAMRGYADAYQKLYKRMPKELRAIDANRVIVNGACINAEELQSLAQQLERQHAALQKNRGVFTRIVRRFRV